MDKLADLLRQGADKLVNLPTEAQRFVTNPQAFIQLLTGKNALPRETGFAAGATGLPAQQGTVLDPNYQAYMQGYEQGEPFGYAVMATPAVVPIAKALAPQAGQMAENYMVNQGFMPSIVAYHGTPHTIKNKFDISKVGSGSTSTNFGHGIYFAESPDVAGMYMVSRNKIAGPTEGNLYKVDIPDELIPKMVNWYEEVPESVAKPLSNKALEQFGSGLSNTSGERLYKDLVFSFKQKGSKTPEADASKWLSEQGVAGIKYENMQMVKGQGRGTSNYVMFDPTQVKMLNKYENKLNRKELIESQIKDLQNAGD
jgi:hypothetical protein